MSFKQQIPASLGIVALGAAIGVFASGRELSAFEQGGVPSQRAPVAQPQPLAPAGSVTKLTADEAVRLALENNLGLQAERLGPQIGTLAVAQARAVYTPSVISTTSTRRSTTPPDSFLSGGDDIITDE